MTRDDSPPRCAGVDEGWHCLEVGAGGSFTHWLAERVGPGGHVLATDIDPRFLESLAGPTLEVRQNDVTADPLPEANFNLVHARLVLSHLPAREAALESIVRATRPGGWLLLEEFDLLSMSADPTMNPVEGLPRAYAAMQRLMGERDVDLRFGRRLPGRLCTHGLVDLLRANFKQLRAAVVAAEGWTEAEFDREVSALDDPVHISPSPIMWAV
jgi:ubiquinone/menaquinone biosynthesis C-methylase UbiE